MRTWFLFVFVIGVLTPMFGIWAAAVESENRAVPSKPWTINTNLVRQDYENGDFDRVAKALMPILKIEQRVSHADSVFAYRLLGVVYVSHPATQELGRHCWFRLLDLDPQANLLDLYVGQEMDRLWERTRSEHALRTEETKRTEESWAWLSPDDLSAMENLSITDLKSDPASSLAATSTQTEGGNATLSLNQEKSNVAVLRGPIVNATDSSLESDENPFGMASPSRPKSVLKPLWQRPTWWVSSIAATGVLGFTLYFALNGDRPTTEKIYHVSDQASR